MRYIIAILLLTAALQSVNAEPVYGLSLVKKARNNDAEALFWWKLASANGHEYALYNFENACKNLSAEEKDQLQARAEKWMTEHTGRGGQ